MYLTTDDGVSGQCDIKEVKFGDMEGFRRWQNELSHKQESQFEEPEHPSYYQGSNEDGKVIEVFDVIDQFVDGDFYLGNVLKYVCRAGKKSKETKKQDLEKALHYIKEAIKRL